MFSLNHEPILRWTLGPGLLLIGVGLAHIGSRIIFTH